MSERAAPRSTGRASGRRERLASPVALALATLAFAAAFTALAPSRDAFRLDAGAATDAAAPLDELRLAYLRARGGAGELDAAETLAAATALAREGRVTEARSLLDAASVAVIGRLERASLDAELAAATLRGAQGGADSEGARVALVAALERLLGHEPAPGVAALERGAELALAADGIRLAAAFHRRLADADPARAADHFTRCGRLLAGRTPRAAASDCLARARAASEDAGRRFALGLELLLVLPAEGPDRRRDALADALLAREGASVAELDALASALLAIERPGDAARVHARLARLDPGSRGRWLRSAARWAEAAGRPAEAAVYLERMTAAEIGADVDAHRRRIEALLVAAGRTRDALARAAVRVAETPADPDAVREAVAMAEAVGETARALGWNAALIAARPDDTEALARQTTLALAVGRPDLARTAAARAHALDPDDVATLERLARLAEWDGAPEAALRHRRRLHALRGADDDLVEIARLAELVRRPAIAAEALGDLARRVEPDADGVRRLVRLHELDGRPDAAADALEDLLRRHGTRASTLRELARLHRRHVRHAEALDAWTRLAARHGRSAEETLARVELHWRLGEEERAATLARDLVGTSFASAASDYQVRLLAEIGWRHRLPDVAALARPLLASVEDADERRLHGRRSIDARLAAGERDAARREAEALWRDGGGTAFALTALELAIESGARTATARLLAATAGDEALRASPRYWSLRATAALRDGDANAARRAYETALGIDANDVEALAGLLWLHIGENDVDAIAGLLAREAARAVAEPALWGAFAIGHVTIGDADGSLAWFERALRTPRADYALLLGFADALDAAGRVEHARRLRGHVVAELRPRLLDGVARDREALLRQYGRVLARYGGADANEAWMRYVLNTDGGRAGDALFWREDMAISWLMATERHEHARLIMTRLHERRLAAPAWQDLALALRAGDEASVRAMLDSGAGLSDGNRILALERIGRDADAWALALRTLEGPSTAEDREIAASRYASLRRFRPSYAAARLRDASSGELDVTETGFSLRHALGPVGVGVDATRERFDSDTLDVGADGTRSRLAVSLFRRTSRHDAELTLGTVDAADDDGLWGAARYARRDPDGRREVALELDWNAAADGAAELALGATRSRVGATLESALGTYGFARLEAGTSELATRIGERRLARGLDARGELGLRGVSSALAWSGSVAAAGSDNDRVETLPEAFRLAPERSIDDVLARRARTVSLNGSLARGGVGEAYPDVAGPRWYVNGGLSRGLSDGALGLQLDVGAGFPLLGSDELGIGVARDARLSGSRAEPDATRIGIEYRHHF